MLATPRFVHLHCLYCGGERRGDDSACRKCLAEAPSVPCRRCRAQVFAPRETCICGERCGAWSVAEANQLGCPRCHGRLERADLAHAGVHVEQCVRCLGCFARTEAFSELVERESMSDASGEHDAPLAFVPPPPSRAAPRQSLLDEVRCPHCATVMERVRFAQKAGMLIDVCPKHGVWLDAGELPQILEHVRRVAAGDAVPDEADRAETQRWSEVLTANLAQEQSVASHLGPVDGSGRPSTAAVFAATAIGGPWVGLFVALRGGRRR